MENRIKNYEKFIKKAAEKPTPELIEYHREMLKNFQHERAIHLSVTFFFAALALVMLGISIWLSTFVEWLPLLPLYSITVILVVLTGFYVKHYYFLENHVQKLYDISEKLYNSGKISIPQKLISAVEKVLENKKK